MNSHFNSFTPEAMRAFGEKLAEGARARIEFLQTTRDQTSTMLAGFRKDLREVEADRRQRAERDADSRRIFASELRASVHALRSRFDLNRKEMAGDLREMAHEYRAAADAFRTRPGRPADTQSRRGPPPRQMQMQPMQQPKQAQPAQQPKHGQQAQQTPPSKPATSEPGHAKTTAAEDAAVKKATL